MQQNLERKMENLNVPTVESTSSSLEPLEQRMEGFIKQYNRLESKIEANEAVLDSLETRHYRLHEQMELIGEQNDFQARETQLAIDQLHYNLTEIQVQCEQALQRTVNKS
jgi:predicted RNase H-like nuclease (RuvC/YqgF family)